MSVEGSGTPSIGKNAKVDVPARRLSCALIAEKLQLPRRPGRAMGRTARSIGPRATTFKSAIRLSG